jgi:hypothetical protein
MFAIGDRVAWIQDGELVIGVVAGIMERDYIVRPLLDHVAKHKVIPHDAVLEDVRR